ncbi:MAG TPA: 4-hydroxy-tetrahydrodipicolinate reductase [Chitinispirillaceae bacterium]|nr:4-hydroxy-tetrahydrodipicolinate reductase [Chitinispirillaceae bacterium]
MALKIIIAGALGRMGMEIAQIVLEDNSLNLYACIEQPGHSAIGKDYGTCLGRGPLNIKIIDSIDSLDCQDSILIDFSSVSSSHMFLEKAPQKSLKMVIGTTGLGCSELDLAQKASLSVPLIVSPNMSLGVNLLFYLTAQVAASLKDQFDIEIIEAHHRFKKDSPSGTAKRLGEIVSQSLGLSYEQAVKNGREGISENTRTSTEIGMHAVRGGDIVGDHTVLFAGMGERIELRHMAHSRKTFAQGAVIAAKWLAGKNPGLYSMRDVLGL